MSPTHTRPACALFLVILTSACGGGEGTPATPDAGSPDATPAAVANLLLDFDPDSVDPAISYYGVTWQYEYATCALLLNYADDDTTTLVPEIATALPDISADGLTYTFHIGGGFKLSPPSNEVITAATMKATFDRAMDPALQGPGVDFMSDVATIEVTGAAQDQLVFTLSQANGDFLARVAMPFFCAVPSDTPHTAQTTPVPSAGPYYMASYAPGEILFLKNPNYQGSRPHTLDGFHYTTNVSGADAIDLVKNNEADYTATAPPADGRAALVAAYGPASADPRLYINPVPGYRFLTLNASRPTFADPDVRKAVQYAVDRQAIAEVADMTPNDDYLVPGIPGYAGTHPYPLTGPDATMAGMLLAGTPSIVLYVRDGRPIDMAVGDVVKANLTAVGFDVTVTLIDPMALYDALANPDEPWDIAVVGWFADYPDPFDLLNILLHGDFDFAESHWNDAIFNAELEHAETLTGPARADEYRRLDVEAMAASPMVVLGNPSQYELFSQRMGCQVHQFYGVDLAALCIRSE